MYQSHPRLHQPGLEVQCAPPRPVLRFLLADPAPHPIDEDVPILRHWTFCFHRDVSNRIPFQVVRVPNVVATLEQVLSIHGNDFRVVPAQSFSPRAYPKLHRSFLRESICQDLQQRLVVGGHADDVTRQNANHHLVTRFVQTSNGSRHLLSELPIWRAQACKIHKLHTSAQDFSNFLCERIGVCLTKFWCDLLVPETFQRCLGHLSDDLPVRYIPSDALVARMLISQSSVCCCSHR
mmetsp:Transcript_62210/g.131482  ORF Transcript_62210/g.131482 Transcript_62210/m.131482 type:complete len:236 (+) Transcript_62210:1583-2290(+)